MERAEDAGAPEERGAWAKELRKIERRGGSARMSICWTHIVVFAKLAKGIFHGPLATILVGFAR